MSENWAEKFARLTDFERSQMLDWLYWADPDRIIHAAIACALEMYCTGCGSQLPDFPQLSNRHWTLIANRQRPLLKEAGMLVQHICQSCENFTLCSICGLNAVCTLPGHEMTKIDLRELLEGGSTWKGYSPGTPYRIQMSLLTVSARLLRLKAGFCLTCRDTRPGNFPGQKTQEQERFFKSWAACFRPRVYDLFVSSQKGCPVCAILWRGVTLFFPENTLLANPQVGLQSTDTSLSVSLWNVRESLIFGRDANSQDLEHEWQKLEVAKLTEKHFGSEMSFDTIRNWLSSCEKTHGHPKCARSAEAPLPRRIIEILGIHDDGSPFLKLRETFGESAKYIALSHRWGKKNPKTTKENLFQMYTGIAFENLPKTYQDAITCAQRLEVRYVWIDSLCIIQDSDEDWDQESAKMGDIYENAYLVVDAAGADGEERGFLERSEEYSGIHLEKLGSEEASGIIVRKEIPHKTTWNSNDLNNIGTRPKFLGFNSTSSRAWCMQEVSLSRRTLSFYRFEVAWECHWEMACECGFLPEPLEISERGSDRELLSKSSSDTNEDQARSNFRVTAQFMGTGLLHFEFKPSCDCEYTQKPFAFLGTRESIFEEWRLMIIPQYTSRSLSVATDRLPALSAMAKVVANQDRSEAHEFPKYLAGVWRDDIQLGLLWSVPEAELLPEAYIGPSFSWASVNRLVTYAITGPSFVKPSKNGGSASHFGDIKIELLDAHVELLGSNPFGKVKSAYVRIRGLEIVVHLFAGDRFYPFGEGRWEKDRYRMLYKNKQIKFRPDTELQEIEMQHKGGSYATVNRSREIQTEDWKAQLNCVLVADAYDRSWVKRDEEPRSFAILVLGQVVTETGELAYQRLGLAILKQEYGESLEWLNGLKSEEFLIV